jgi:hypothetical protein
MSEFSKSIDGAYILPVADAALVTWLIAHGIEDGKPIFVQFEFRHDKPGATYRGVPLKRVGE